jgi:hypothetical protein
VGVKRIPIVNRTIEKYPWYIKSVLSGKWISLAKYVENNASKFPNINELVTSKSDEDATPFCHDMIRLLSPMILESDSVFLRTVNRRLANHAKNVKIAATLKNLGLWEFIEADTTPTNNTTAHLEDIYPLFPQTYKAHCPDIDSIKAVAHYINAVDCFHNAGGSYIKT